MAILTDATVIIEPPAPPPVPYGLFNAAVGPLPLPRVEAAVGGIEYQPDTCGIARLWASGCESVTAKVFDEGVDTISADPFVVYSSWLCGSIGYTEEEIRRRLLTRLNLKAQRAVEARLWQGNTGLGLTGILPAEATSLGAATCPTEAVRLLEQALADNGVVGGIIHARVGMADYLGTDHLIEHPRANLMTTHYGTSYAFGQGYGGTGPAGQAVTSTTEWMYASGRVIVWASDTFVPPIREVLKRSNNQQYAIAEQQYMLAVECGVWAVQVTRECP
jgi:hypothetical protein